MDLRSEWNGDLSRAYNIEEWKQLDYKGPVKAKKSKGIFLKKVM